jgi:putative tryptophan/tyrosine transport system substrate-binding protein
MKIRNTTNALGALLVVACALLAPARNASAADLSTKVARIGYLTVNPPLPGVGASLIAQELGKLGYVEGKNLVVESRHANGDPDGMGAAAAELVKLNVDVIYAVTNPAGFAAQRATQSIPIVVWGAHGAVETGLVPSLRRPGGNLTGVESLAPELDAKRIELLKQIVPGLARLAVLYDTGDQGSPLHMKAIEAAGKALGVAFTPLEVRRPEDFDSVLAGASGKPLGGLLTLSSNLTFRNGKRIMDFALANRLPSLCEFKQLAQAGCLLSYGPTFDEITQRSAALIDKILKGTPPGELAVEQMTRFELVINLKTAKALGITIPQAVLVQADEVIE